MTYFAKSLDKIADKNEELSSRLHSLAKDIEETVYNIKSAVTKIKGNIKAELRHCGEYLEVTFPEQTSNSILKPIPADPSSVASQDAKSKYVIQSEPLRKCTQAVALSTIVEAPKDAEMNVEQPKSAEQEAISSSSKPVKKKRKLLQLEDSEDEFPTQPEIKKNEAKSKALFDESFGFEVSIEEIKRAYGVLPENNDQSASGNKDSTNILDHQQYALERQMKHEQELKIVGKFLQLLPYEFNSLAAFRFLQELLFHILFRVTCTVYYISFPHISSTSA